MARSRANRLSGAWNTLFHFTRANGRKDFS